MPFISGALIGVASLFLILYAQLLLRWRKGLRQLYRRKRDGRIPENAEGLSVVVPFRNERGRVEKLLADLLEQVETPCPVEFIFVDDRSGDEGKRVLEEKGSSSELVQVLESEKEGKKAALDQGIRTASYPWILTMDADCRVGKIFLQTLFQERSGMDHDLYLLPVLYHSPKKLFEKLLYFESLALLSVLQGSAEKDEPVLANGAGMLFKRSLFLDDGGYSGHERIDSGDDLFLLQEWRMKGRRVSALSDPELLIRTRYPDGIGEAMEQRSRWAGKAKAFKDRTAFLAGTTIAACNMMLVLNLLAVPFLWWNSLFAIISWGLKAGLDRIFLILAARKYDAAIPWKLFSLAAFLYPFQVTLIPLMRLFRRPVWKGRPVRERR